MIRKLRDVKLLSSKSSGAAADELLPLIKSDSAYTKTKAGCDMPVANSNPKWGSSLQVDTSGYLGLCEMFLTL